MNWTFLVSINVDSTDPAQLAGYAEDIHTDLELNFDVEYVRPWTSPGAPTPGAVQLPPSIGGLGGPSGLPSSATETGDGGIIGGGLF